MRDYGRVHGSFWTSPTIVDLSDDAKMLALYLLTSSHTTIAGVFRLPIGYVSEDLRWNGARVEEGFRQLFENGFANRCETTKWVWIVKHLEWNPPENPNQRKAAAKVAQSVPTECSWKRVFMRVCGPKLGLKEEPFPNSSETVRQPFLNQEQEQEQKKDPVLRTAEPSARPNSSPLEAIDSEPPDDPPDLPSPMTAKERAWELGVSILGESGRSILGKWVATHGVDRVLEALQACAKENPIEPKAWLVKALAQRAEHPAPPRRNGNGSGRDEPVDLLADPQPEWATKAGFHNRFEAENAGCLRHNAHLYRDGKRIAKEVH